MKWVMELFVHHAMLAYELMYFWHCVHQWVFSLCRMIAWGLEMMHISVLLFSSTSTSIRDQPTCTMEWETVIDFCLLDLENCIYCYFARHLWYVALHNPLKRLKFDLNISRNISRIYVVIVEIKRRVCGNASLYMENDRKLEYISGIKSIRTNSREERAGDWWILYIWMTFPYVCDLHCVVV